MCSRRRARRGIPRRWWNESPVTVDGQITIDESAVTIDQPTVTIDQPTVTIDQSAVDSFNGSATLRSFNSPLHSTLRSFNSPLHSTLRSFDSPLHSTLRSFDSTIVAFGWATGQWVPIDWQANAGTARRFLEPRPTIDPAEHSPRRGSGGRLPAKPTLHTASPRQPTRFRNQAWYR